MGVPHAHCSKPDGSLRSLADLREVNKGIMRKPYPLKDIGYATEARRLHVCNFIRPENGILPQDMNTICQETLYSSLTLEIWVLSVTHGSKYSPDNFQEKMRNSCLDWSLQEHT
jgi:hypothetical protein